MLPFHQCLQTTNIAIIICSVPHTSIFSFWKRMADVKIFNQSCIIFCGTQQTANSRSWDMQLWNMYSKENTNQMWEKLTTDRLSNYKFMIWSFSCMSWTFCNWSVHDNFPCIIKSLCSKFLNLQSKKHLARLPKIL